MTALKQLGMRSSRRPAVVVDESDDADDDVKRRKAWGIFYSAGIGDRDSSARDPVKAYLKKRGVNRIPKGCFAMVRHGRPALVCPVRGSDGAFLGAHVTRLNGRDKNRKMYGPVKGGHIEIGQSADSETLLLAEGVEDAASVHELTGLPAWSALSASNMPAVGIPVEFREVIICRDADQAGKEAATRLADRLVREGRSVRIAPPPRPFKDWNEAACDPDTDKTALQAGITEADEIEPPSGPVLISEADLLELELPPRQLLVAPWLPQAGLAMIFGPRGIAKTYLAMAIALAVTRGRPFLGWTCRHPVGVLYIDGEMPAAELKKRLRALTQCFPGPAPHGIEFLTPDLQPGGMPDLGTADGQEVVDRLLSRDTRLIIVDSLATLCPALKENDADAWSHMQSWLLRHRAAGRTVLLLHHAGKTGKQRGTSRKEDILDTVINLRRPSDYCPEEGARFEIHYEKARTFYGVDAKPVEVSMSTDDEGLLTWTTKSLQESVLEKVAGLCREGIPQKDIAKELGLTPGRVSQLVKEAREKGLMAAFGSQEPEDMDNDDDDGAKDAV